MVENLREASDRNTQPHQNILVAICTQRMVPGIRGPFTRIHSGIFFAISVEASSDGFLFIQVSTTELSDLPPPCRSHDALRRHTGTARTIRRTSKSLQIELPRHPVAVVYPTELPAESVVIRWHQYRSVGRKLAEGYVKLSLALALDEKRYRRGEGEGVFNRTVDADDGLTGQREVRSLDLVRGKPRPSGRGQERGRQSRSLPLALVRCLLLFDVLPDNGDRRTTAATGEVGRRPQRSAP